jgi:uncharacterized protein
MTELQPDDAVSEDGRLPLPDTGHWGGPAILGLSAIVVLGVVVAWIVGAVVLGLFIDFSLMDLFEDRGGLNLRSSYVDVTMLLYWLGAFAGLFLMLKFVRQRGFMGAPEYLGLAPIRHLPLLMWAGVLLAYYALFVLLPELTMASNGLSFGPVGGGTFLYFVTAVTIAPLFEEALFRGFMFSGLARSRVGLASTILLTNALWTMVHLRPAVDWFDEVYGLAVLFGAGLIFTFARLRTGSLLAPIALHAGWNATLLLVDVTFLSKT